jgi:hypothetical protein
VQKYIISPAIELMLRHKYNTTNEYKVNRCIHMIGDFFAINGKDVCLSCSHKYFHTCFDQDDCEYYIHRFVILNDLFSSLEYHIPVFSSYINPINLSSNDEVKIIDDTYTLIKKSKIAQIIKIELKEPNILPEPKTLAEAICFRKKPEIVSFRKIFKSWCESLQNMDDETAIELITKDFIKAKNFFDRRHRKDDETRKLRNTVINILMDFVSGIMPLHLTFPYTIKKRLNERNEALDKQKNEWFIIN